MKLFRSISAFRKKFIDPLLTLKNALIIGAAVIALLLAYFITPYPPNYLAGFNHSIKIRDRNGILLAELTPDKTGFNTEMAFEETSPKLILLLLNAEDRDYYRHSGIHPLSMARAMLQNIKSGRFVSGGSTITQQLVKMQNGIIRNNVWTKLVEIFKAVKLSLHFSKNQLLTAYMNQVYLGNHIYGIKKASRVYFHKEVYNLSLLESAALICAIREPARLDFYRNIDSLQNKALSMLKRALDSRVITIEDWRAVESSRLLVYPGEQSLYAPHFALWAVDEAKRLIPANEKIQEIVTTLDLKLYQDLLEIGKNRIRLLRKNNAHDLGLLMIDNKSGEVLAMIGSLDFFSDDGMINSVLAHRQAASTMKAFTYSLALESRRFTASSILPDIYSEFPSAFGKYIPRNYNGLYHGPVRLAMAFGSSYNVPAASHAESAGIAGILPVPQESRLSID